MTSLKQSEQIGFFLLVKRMYSFLVEIVQHSCCTISTRNVEITLFGFLSFLQTTPFSPEYTHFSRKKPNVGFDCRTLAILHSKHAYMSLPLHLQVGWLYVRNSWPDARTWPLMSPSTFGSTSSSSTASGWQHQSSCCTSRGRGAASPLWGRAKTTDIPRSFNDTRRWTDHRAERSWWKGSRSSAAQCGGITLSRIHFK